MTVFRNYILWIFGIALVGVLAGCQVSASNTGNQIIVVVKDESLVKRPDVIEIVTTSMNFDAPGEIPSGWITFRFINNSSMVHFALLERMPEGKTIRDQQKDIAPVFQNIMDNINQKPLSAPDAGFDLPEWFGGIENLSGPGFVSPNHIAETTVYVEPGSYLIECYVKSNGIFHSYNPAPDINGMVHQIEVVDKASGGKVPEPTLNVNLSTERGIEIVDEINAGKHVVAVHFADQKIYEHFLGHDVHLVKLSGSTDLNALNAWMDWSKPGGLGTPCPAEFLGGTHEMPAGSTGYFNVELEPGDYAFIAEVPNPASLNMLKTFSVPEVK
jgi:hypothetical protein